MSVQDLTGATDFHSGVVEEFDGKYQTSPDFVERGKVWKTVLDQHAKSGDKVLDAGCGSGYFSFYLADKGCQVQGIDGSEKMVAFCREKAEKTGSNQIQFDAAMLPLTDEQFSDPKDVIIASSVLEYVEDIDALLQGLANRVRSGGTLIVSMPNRSSLYRKFEAFMFRLTGRPAYLAHVRNVLTLRDFQSRLARVGFVVDDHQYYAGNHPILKVMRAVLPRALSCNLFLCVAKKSDDVS